MNVAQFAVGDEAGKNADDDESEENTPEGEASSLVAGVLTNGEILLSGIGEVNSGIGEVPLESLFYEAGLEGLQILVVGADGRDAESSP